jgi:predicted alpha/beta hydrolase family esterase
MKKQVLIIHGGTTFENKAEYYKYLENQTIDIERIAPGYDWKMTIQDDLGEDYAVLCPKMPNSTYAIYQEWKIWFENLLTILDEDLILVGHSLGGIFLAKYLSEHLIDNKISKLILVAAPFTETADEPLASFKLGKNLNNLDKQVSSIFIIHSKDDPVVPFSDSLLYAENLKNAEHISFKDKKHFNSEKFTDLAKIIKQP